MLGQAYYDKGLIPQSELARAQGLFYFGAMKQAQEFAKRAQAGLKPGTPGLGEGRRHRQLQAADLTH